MVKHTQTIRRKIPTNCLSVFNHFVGLALKGVELTLKGVMSLPNLCLYYHYKPSLIIKILFGSIFYG